MTTSKDRPGRMDMTVADQMDCLLRHPSEKSSRPSLQEKWDYQAQSHSKSEQNGVVFGVAMERGPVVAQLRDKPGGSLPIDFGG